MKALSQKERNEKGGWVKEIEDAKEKLQRAIEDYNATVEPLKDKIIEALEHLNEMISQADAWRSDISKDQELFADMKSNAWKESPTGEQYQDWIVAWAEPLQPLDLNLPELIDTFECDTADDLKELPDEA